MYDPHGYLAAFNLTAIFAEYSDDLAALLVKADDVPDCTDLACDACKLCADYDRYQASL